MASAASNDPQNPSSVQEAHARAALRLLEETSEGWFLASRDGVFVDCSPRFLRFLQTTREKILGKSIFSVLTDENRSEEPPRVDLVMQGQAVTNRRVFRIPNGDTVTVEATAIRADDDHFYVSMRSVQEVVDAHLELDSQAELLSDNESRLDHLIAAVPGAIYRCDCRGTEWQMAYISDAILAISGRRPSEFLGPKKRSFDSVVHLNDIGPLNQVIFDAIDRRDSWSIEYRIIHRDGEERWVYERGQATFDANGEVRWLDGLIIDITESRKAEEERKRLEAQLQQAQRLESLGRIAGGIAHDFNNFISPVLGYSDLAIRKLNQDDPLLRTFEIIRNAAEKAANLTSRMLAFSKKRPLKMRVRPFNEAVLSNRSILRSAISESIDFRIESAPELARKNVKLDETQLTQVLMNLCVNAADALANEGKLTISTHILELDAFNAHGRAPGIYAGIRVSDNGSGMDELTMMQVFDPFFSTKAEGKGTGLGLSMSFSIMEQHGGAIVVESQEGVGTTFTLYFPISEEEPTRHESVKLSAVAQPKGELIMVVEDDQLVRDLMVNILLEAGYRVLSAESAANALDIAKTRGSDFDLLLSDIIMPLVNGRQLYDRLKADFPRLPALFVSGYSGEIAHATPSDDKRVAFLAKPFLPETLTSLVRKLLDQNAKLTRR